jgi:hypothetical protein
MKRWIILATFTLLAILLLGPSSRLVRPSFAQEIPGAGFSVLLCQAEAAGGCAGQLCVTTLSDNGSVAEVKITHGKTCSIHIVNYEDSVSDPDGVLDCGDTILSVTKTGEACTP